jgi:hypothetical protein
MLSIRRINDFDFGSYGTRASVDIAVGDYETKVTIDTNRQKEIEVSKNPFLENLEQAVGLDYSDLIAEYQKQIENIEEVREEQRKEKRAKQYDEHWAVKEPKNEKFPSFLPADHAVTLQVESKEEYVARKGVGVDTYLIYNGHRIAVKYADVSGQWHKKMMFTIDGSITDYKRRNYASISNAADKFVKLVETKIRREEEEKERAEKQLRTVEETLARYTALFPNYTVTHKKEWNSREHGNGYYSNNYYLITEAKTFTLSNTNDDGLLWFAGLGKLTPEQINQVLQIINQKY